MLTALTECYFDCGLLRAQPAGWLCKGAEIWKVLSLATAGDEILVDVMQGS